MLDPNDPIRVAFNGAAALFVAASAVYLARGVVQHLASDRPMPFVALAYMSHPAARALAALAETGALVGLTWVTFAAATDPNEPSAANLAMYRVAFGIEIVVVLWAVARLVRAATSR